jgi:hypothetical protein
MKIEEIMFGQSFEDGVPRWQKFDIKASPEPGETPEQVADQIKQIIDGWHKDRNPHLYSSAFGSQRVPAESIADDPEFEELKRRLGHMEYREDAIALINNNGFRLNVELNKIANAKPSRNANS